MYSEGIRVFYAGCAVGVDTWTAEIVLELKKQADFSEIELFCVIPFPNHDEKFTARQKKRTQHILRICDYQEVINRHYSPVAYKRQNYYMVDNSQYMIAIYDQNRSERSGLGQMVNYAVKKNLQISCIHPDTAEVSKYTP